MLSGSSGANAFADLIGIDKVQAVRPEEYIDERGLAGAVWTGDDNQDAVSGFDRVSNAFPDATGRTHHRARRRAATVRTNARFSSRPRVRLPLGATRMMAPDPLGSLS
jgi:hypothetical protein